MCKPGVQMPAASTHRAIPPRSSKRYELATASATSLNQALMTVIKGRGWGFPIQARWSASRKMDVVLCLLRGENLEGFSRELGVEAHRIAAWRVELLGGLSRGPQRSLRCRWIA